MENEKSPAVLFQELRAILDSLDGEESGILPRARSEMSPSIGDSQAAAMPAFAA